MHRFVHSRGFWDGRTADPYSTIRSGWTKEDFETRTDETIVGMAEPLGGTVLDLGCGLGYVCKIIAPIAAWYVGIDWSLGMIEHARDMNREHMNATFLLGDGRSIPAYDDAFDCAVSEQMFIHLERDVTLGYFAELLRVVRPGGRILLEIPKAGEYVNGLTPPEISEAFAGAQSVELLSENVCSYIEVVV